MTDLCNQLYGYHIGENRISFYGFIKNYHDHVHILSSLPTDRNTVDNILKPSLQNVNLDTVFEFTTNNKTQSKLTQYDASKPVYDKNVLTLKLQRNEYNRGTNRSREKDRQPFQHVSSKPPSHNQLTIKKSGEGQNEDKRPNLRQKQSPEVGDNVVGDTSNNNKSMICEGRSPDKIEQLLVNKKHCEYIVAVLALIYIQLKTQEYPKKVLAQNDTKNSKPPEELERYYSSITKTLMTSVNQLNLRDLEIKITFHKTRDAKFYSHCNYSKELKQIYPFVNVNIEGSTTEKENAVKSCPDGLKHIECYHENDKTSKINVFEITKKNVEPQFCRQVGEFLKVYDTGRTNLLAIGCHMYGEMLVELFVGLEEQELNLLDLSSNKELGEKSFEILGREVSKNRISCLRLSNCQVNGRCVEKFKNNHRMGGKLKELDLSYNPFIDIDEFEALGETVKLYGIEKLNLAGCKLRKRHVESFHKSSQGHQMIKFNVRDNYTIGGGVVKLADIVKDYRLKDLDLSECKLWPKHIREFGEALENSTLDTLNLSDRKRIPNKEHIEALCGIIKNVRKNLILQFGKMKESLRDILQDAWDRRPVDTHANMIITLSTETIARDKETGHS